MPAKYREMHDFHEYYSGARTAPYLTIFVGGNHEASNYLFELYYGGWAAPNIYYMGAANVLRLGPLRIAGLSGIWKGYNYRKPHYERLPYNQDDVKSVYHVRELDVRKLMQIRTQVDVGISHDWPKGVEWMGNWKKLFRQKSHFEEDARKGQLGSLAAKYVMDRLRPPYWFSAHLHCKYAAFVDHGQEMPPQQSLPSANSMPDNGGNGSDQAIDATIANGATEAGSAAEAATKNADEIDLDMDDAEEQPAPQTLPANADEIDLELEEDPDSTATAVAAPGQGLDGTKVSLQELTGTGTGPEGSNNSAVSEDLRAQLPAAFSRPTPTPAQQPLSHPEEIGNKMTKFLALDKCLPNRDFLQLLPVLPSTATDKPTERPLKLEYDKEWLAITRVFASDLVVGDPVARVPADLGEAHYKPLIESMEQWVEENLVQSGCMIVPRNFETIAPVYDPARGINVQENPMEYPNNQTIAFCDMLQIPNPFNISEEGRDERMRNGPREEEQRRGGGFGRGRGGFRGGRGRGGRGRGGDRGRSRGRGSRW